MAHGVLSSKITGKPSQDGWAQVYDYSPFDQKTLDEKGRMFSLISVIHRSDEEKETSPGIGSVILAREVLNKIHEEYYTSNFTIENNPLVILKKIVEDINKNYGKGGSLQIALAVLVKNIIYIAVGGGAKIYIYRQGSYLLLVSSDRNSIQSASGNIRIGDTFILGTDNFFDRVNQEVIKSTLSVGSVEAFAENISSQPAFPDGEANLAVLTIHITGTNEKLFEAPPPLKINDNSAPKIVNTSQAEAKTGLVIPRPDVSINIKNVPSLFKKIFEKKLYIQDTELSDEAIKRQRMAASVGLVLLAVLVASIFFGIRQKKENDIKNKYANEIETATHELVESENLQTLNPERSRELFLQGRQRVLGIAASGINSKEIDELKGIVEKNQGKILGEYRPAVETFVDLGLLTEGFVGEQLSISGDDLYILDAKSKKVAKVGVENKRAEVIAGPTKIDEADSFTSYSDWVYIANTKGIFEISKDLRKVSDEVWSDALIYAFSSNLYVLDRQNSDIFRLTSGGEVFGQSSKWTIDDHGIDLSSSVSWSIDGSVWILDEEGKVYRYTRGNPQNFRLSIVGIADFKPVYLFTREEVNDIYFLDKENAKIVVFDKEGKFKAQYINDEIKNTFQFAVSEKDKKMILLNGSKLFSMQLAHIE